ncbi:hypothetical protein HDU89_000457 [Geranomyces variabilis]|nr:hypothetical protein HDU89_000457 [Geranomyces variabilis]
MSTRTSLRASSKTSASTVAGPPTLTLETVALLKGEGLKLACKQAGIHPVPKKVGDQRKALREHLSGNAAEAGLMEQPGHPGLDGGQRRPMTEEEIRIAASCPRLPPEIIQHIFTGPVLDELAAIRHDAWESQALAKAPHFSSKHLPFSNILRQASSRLYLPTNATRNLPASPSCAQGVGAGGGLVAGRHHQQQLVVAGGGVPRECDRRSLQFRREPRDHGSGGGGERSEKKKKKKRRKRMVEAKADEAEEEEQDEERQHRLRQKKKGSVD